MEIFSNETSYFNETLVEEYEANFLGLVCSVLPIITLVGNGAVLRAVQREKNLQNSTNFLIVSLAVADLLVGLIVMPWGIYALVIRFPLSGSSSSSFIFITFFPGQPSVASSLRHLRLVHDHRRDLLHGIYFQLGGYQCGSVSKWKYETSLEKKNLR